MDLNVCLLLDHSLWLSGSHSVVSIQLEIVRSAHSQDHPRPAESETRVGLAICLQLFVCR